MSGIAIKILTEQRKRLLATIMRSAEDSDWWPELERAEQETYRTQVVTAINVFYELCRDIVKAADSESLVNEEVVELIERIHESQRRMERATIRTASQGTLEVAGA